MTTEIRLKTICFETREDAEIYAEHFRQIHRNLINGTPVYLKITQGDWKGSIARFECEQLKNRYNEDIIDLERISVQHNKSYFNASVYYDVNRGSLHGRLKWDGRRNNPQHFLSSGDIWLKDYDGPTVWEKFDAKAAREEMVNNAEIFDIDGEKINIGDSCIYMNLRYGQGGQLEHGKLKGFRAEVSSPKYKELVSIFESDEGVESSLKHPASMVWKKKEYKCSEESGE